MHRRRGSAPIAERFVNSKRAYARARARRREKSFFTRYSVPRRNRGEYVFFSKPDFTRRFLVVKLFGPTRAISLHFSRRLRMRSLIPFVPLAIRSLPHIFPSRTRGIPLFTRPTSVFISLFTFRKVQAKSEWRGSAGRIVGGFIPVAVRAGAMYLQFA